jgi:SAM-dependent methyltransferase
MSPPALLDQVNAYYTRRVHEYGPTPRGVDWNSADSQELRFIQLLKIVYDNQPSVLGDYGCGYGALLDFLGAQNRAYEYRGYDISDAMCAAARSRHGADVGAGFSVNEESLRGCDFVVASGIFNVRLKTPVADWKAYVFETVGRLASLGQRGFAFNCLTSYSDAERMRPDLFYADPCELFDYCKRRFSRNVALLHDYGLYEFTLLVRT